MKLPVVIIAESFGRNFLPLSYDKNEILFPAVDKSILVHMLDYLGDQNVSNIYICCTSHKFEVKEATRQFLKRSSKPIKVEIVTGSWNSLSQVMNHIYKLKLINSDFVLVTAPFLSKINLDILYQRFQNFRHYDPKTLMLLCFRDFDPKLTEPAYQNMVINNLILIFGDDYKLHSIKKGNKVLLLESCLSNLSETFNVYKNTIDTHISICDAKVLEYLSIPNYEFITKDEFVSHILENTLKDLPKDNIYIHKTNELAIPLQNYFLYDNICKEIINNLHDAEAKHLRVSKFVYLAKNVELAKDATLKNKVYIGKNSKIDSSCYISNSLIGENCYIGNNVGIENCIIWNNVVIDDGCDLDNCLVADEAYIKSDGLIKPKSIIGKGVIVGNGAIIKEETILTSKLYEPKNPRIPEKIGFGGIGFRFLPRIDFSIEIKPWFFTQEMENGSSDYGNSISSSGTEDNEDYDTANSEIAMDSEHFEKELLNCLKTFFDKKTIMESVIHEINSYMLTYNIHINKFISQIVTAILKLPCVSNEVTLHAQYFAALQPLLKYYLPLFKHYISTWDYQLICIESLELFFFKNPSLISQTTKIVYFLYDKCVLDEQVILRWNKLGNASFESDLEQDIRKQLQPFIKWLQEAEEESSDED